MPKKVPFIFKEIDDAREFLKNSWEAFKKLTSIESRRLFILELKASPEFRIAVLISGNDHSREIRRRERVSPKKPTWTERRKGFMRDFENATSPDHFTRLSCFEGSPSRNFNVDLRYMREFYKRNRMPGNP
ncbi:MAG: hypothetical protein JWM20_249 [Patescibacteria group bacterium]|nr:hypothetical protein [Patescibacteria group bacterium]